MNKNDLVNYVRENTSLNLTNCEQAVTAVLAGITDALAKKDDVSFVGFGTFTITKRKARTGRNPRTGEPLNIPAANQVKFRPGKNLKERVV